MDNVDDREQNDKQVLLTILPEEVWLLVFDKLGEDDLEKISNSSLFFRNLLYQERVRFLFPSVWKVLAKRIDDNARRKGLVYGSAVDVTDGWFKVTKVCFLEWIGLTKKIRITCSSWTKAVDNYYEHHPYHRQLHEIHLYTNEARWDQKIILDLTTNRFCFDENLGPRFLNQFLRHFNPTHEDQERNPIFGRSVVFQFNDDDDEDAERYGNLMSTFLSKYGENIWYAIIFKSVMTSGDGVVTYTKLRTALELMPNLKVLRMENFEDTGPMLQQEINQRALPTLRRLESLDLSNVCFPIIQEFIQSNAHILTLGITKEIVIEDYAIFNRQLPNLKKLAIQFHSRHEFQALVDCQVVWPLTELCFAVADSVGVGITWQEIMTFVQMKWKDTLTHLEIKLPKMRREIDVAQMYRQSEDGSSGSILPQLTHLKLIVENLPCLDFLLTLRESISFLNMDIWTKTKEKDMIENRESGSIIKFFSHLECLLDSNIWTCFPRLRQTSGYIRFSSFHQLFREPEEITWSHKRNDWMMRN